MRSFFLLLLTLPLVGHAQDPAKTDADKYTVVSENERVRVLRYRDHPGDKTSMHAHPDFIMTALAPFKRRLTLKTGEVKEREFKTGEAVFMPAQSHIGENIGTTDTEVVIVELKEPRLPAKK